MVITMKIYWNDEYCAPNIDFETFRKSKEIATQVVNTLRDSVQVIDPADVPSALAKAHSALSKNVEPAYLNAIMTGNPLWLAKTNGLGWDEGIYPMVLNSTAGILAATDDVLGGERVSCSLSSGLHHAQPSKGKGFCTVNSLALGAKYATDRGAKVVILDLDAHCGGGTAEYIKGTAIKQVDVSILDFDRYESDKNSTLLFDQAWADDAELYKQQVRKALDLVVYMSPDVVFYNAGVDVFPHIDPLYVIEREIMVAETLQKSGARTVLLMAGGYGSLDDIVPLHISTIGAFVAPTAVARGINTAKSTLKFIGELNGV